MTEKQLKKHLHRIWFHYARLRQALNEAHRAEIIQYEPPYQDNAPCAAADLLRERIQKTTQKSIAETVTNEIKRELQWW